MIWGRPRTPLEAARWVVLDCETSGLDAARDRLLSVGAVAVQGERIVPADCFEARVRQETPSAPDNILVHGIGGDEQRQGAEAAAVIDRLSRYLAQGVPVAFHAPFDALVLRRHGLAPAREWLDLAALAPALHPEQGRKLRSLDDWLGQFSIPAQARHDALGDAFAAAQLFLVLLAEAKRQRASTVEAVLKTARAQRWLAPG